MRKKILLFGFKKKQIIFLKKKFKSKTDFVISDKIKKNHLKEIDAIVGITRNGFLDILKKKLIQSNIKYLFIFKLLILIFFASNQMKVNI